jgi:hypothetical protein
VLQVLQSYNSQQVKQPGIATLQGAQAQRDEM